MNEGSHMFQVTQSRADRFFSAMLVFALCALLFTACKSDDEKLAEFSSLGDAYLKESKYPEAVIEFKNVLKIDPNDADAHFALAKTYLRMGRARDAYWEMSETVRLDETNHEARMSFGALSLVARDLEQALAMGEAGIAAEPDDHQGYLLAGRALVSLERTDEAEPMFIKAVELNPEDLDTLLTLATYYAGLPDGREKAEPWFWKGVERFSGFRSHTALAKFLVRDPERMPETEKMFREALKRTPNQDNAVEAYTNMAKFYFATERVDEGVVILEKGIGKLDDKTELIFMLAAYYRVNGNHERAQELIRQAAEEEPDDPTAYLTLSSYLGGQGDLEGALEAANNALEADPESVSAKLRKAEILIDIGFGAIRERIKNGEETADPATDPMIAEGLQLADDILAEVAFQPQAQFVRGKALLAQGNMDAGVAALRVASEGKPDWAEARFALGSALASQGETALARVEVAKALELNPQMLEARRILAAIHQQLGEHEYAIDQGREYLNARPDHNPTRILVAQSLVRLGKRDKAYKELNMIPEDQRDVGVYFALGRIQMNLGEFAEARENMIKAIELSPTNSKILRTLFRMDRQDKDKSKFAETQSRIETAAKENPDDGALIQLAGMVYFAQGNLEEAEKSFVRATELSPEDVEAHQQLARFYTLTGRADETIETYRKAVELHPESAKLHHFLALLYEAQSEKDLARLSYENAIKSDDNHGHAKNNLAYLLADEDLDLDRALDLAQDAKALLPNSANAADTLGWVLYKRGVFGAAVGYLKEAEESSEPDDPALSVIRHHLALAYEADGKTDRALVVLETAVADLDRQARQAKAAGRNVNSPPWESDIREMLERLSSAAT
jgi:tetratricopeptide (TPR) repeat protein